MNKANYNKIISIIIASIMISCSDSGTTENESPAIIGTWRRVDTVTVDIADSSGSIIGSSLRRLTYDLIFRENTSLIMKTQCEYSPQFNYANAVAIFLQQKSPARDTMYSRVKIWRINGDTLRYEDTSAIYPSESNGVYRTYATNAIKRYSISNNALRLTSFEEPLKAAYPPEEQFQRIN
jgi:hypothetical protein